MSVTVRVEGMEKLEQKLKKLLRKMGPDEIEPVLFDAAAIVTEQVQANVNRINRVSGRLSRSPVTKQLELRQGENPRPAISAIERNWRLAKGAPHAHLVERGTTGPRTIKKKSVLRSKTGQFFGKVVAPMSAQPFFKPAWQVTKGRALDYVKRKLARQVEGGV